mmetsp:Transcript_65774/g.59049  ORF Transcript_65774/g.59049 Transcript_65774/m.59049 type:complete len:260 (-) Transcript_65774:821-1600(-)
MLPIHPLYFVNPSPLHYDLFLNYLIAFQMLIFVVLKHLIVLIVNLTLPLIVHLMHHFVLVIVIFVLSIFVSLVYIYYHLQLHLVASFLFDVVDLNIMPLIVQFPDIIYLFYPLQHVIVYYLHVSLLVISLHIQLVAVVHLLNDSLILLHDLTNYPLNLQMHLSFSSLMLPPQIFLDPLLQLLFLIMIHMSLQLLYLVNALNHMDLIIVEYVNVYHLILIIPLIIPLYPYLAYPLVLYDHFHLMLDSLNELKLVHHSNSL